MPYLTYEFMEAYKRLDKLLREAFDSDKGVTTYIDTMQQHPEAARMVDYWDDILWKLKRYRHIRNQFAHEPGAMDEFEVDQDDIAWLEMFYRSAINAEDPLAKYHRRLIDLHRAEARRKEIARRTEAAHREEAAQRAEAARQAKAARREETQRVEAERQADAARRAENLVEEDHSDNSGLAEIGFLGILATVGIASFFIAKMLFAMI